jgi:hypothetical protein
LLMRWSCGLLLFVSSLGFFQGSAPGRQGGARISAKELSAADRVEVFETVWKDIRDTYYDPEFHGLNWQDVHDRYRPRVGSLANDKAFYELVNRMAAEVGVSATIWPIS